MAKEGQKIEVNILDNGVKDISNLQDWGHYFAADEEWPKPKKISTSQLRKFFGALKQIQADFDNKKGEILLLDAKLAYAVGRDVKNGKQTTKIKEFYQLINPLIREVKENKIRFKHFVEVFEAIVAYHKEKEEVQ